MDFLSSQILQYFKLSPTEGQKRLFKQLDRFMDDESERSVFILKGYAGTGKTSILGAFIKALPAVGFNSVLMAPTGRAAKVMANYTGKFASTIHRKIYIQKEDPSSASLSFQLQKNKEEETVYIVDEASMISEMREMGNNGLLRDLVNYVFQGKDNKLLFIGDEAQLPPVNLPLSPALDVGHIEGYYHAKVFSTTLTEVMRQQEGSGILQNATALRQLLLEEEIKLQLITKGFKDFFRMTSERIEDGLRYAYYKYGQENTIVITQSNKNAVLYNRLIRHSIHYSEAEIDNGDMLMVVKNNYNTLSEEHTAGFIANGDFVKVKRLGREEEMHGFRFQHVTLQLADYPDDPEIDTLIILDTLYSDSPNLSQEQNQKLYENVLQDYQWVKTKKERSKLIREDKYMNALQVKFAYALTCHKSQGGQWDAVFVDNFYLKDEEQMHDFIRWLYTAITRGMKEVFLINFPEKYFA